MNLIEGLNIEYINVFDDGLEAKMNLTEFHNQTHGYLHGGATIAFGETVAGYASIKKIGKDQTAVGQNITANHVRPKKTEGYIIARGRLMHKGNRSHVWSVEMYDENDMLISLVTVTNAIVKI